MNIIGKWKVKKLFEMTGDGAVLRAVDELPEGEEYDEMRVMGNSVYEFLPDGRILTLLDSENAAAIGADDAEKYGDSFIIEESSWKEKDGEIFVDSGEEGEDADGNPYDPFIPLEFDEDGNIIWGGLLVLKRA